MAKACVVGRVGAQGSLGSLNSLLEAVYDLPSVRKAPPFRAGMNRTDCVAILFLTLMRYLLLHNGLPNRRNRCAATKE